MFILILRFHKTFGAKFQYLPCDSSFHYFEYSFSPILFEIIMAHLPFRMVYKGKWRGWKTVKEDEEHQNFPCLVGLLSEEGSELFPI